MDRRSGDALLRPLLRHGAHLSQASFWALLGVLLFVGPSRSAYGQTQFEERLPKRYYPAIPDRTGALGVADLDRDGDLDVVVGNQNRERARLHLNNGDGIFTDVTATHMPPNANETVALGLGDVDGDGDLDLVLGNFSDQDRLLLNDGAARFTDVTATQWPSNPNGAREVLFGDADGDGDLDVVLPTSTGNKQTRLYLNDGFGFYVDATAGRMPVDSGFQAGAIGDVDGDGDLDVVLGDFDQDHLYVNDGFGFFTDVTGTHLPVESRQAAVMELADLDGDLDLDLVVGNYRDPNSLYLNDGAGFFSDATSRLPMHSDLTQSLAIDDVDGDFDLDIAFGSTSGGRLYRNDGTATFFESPSPLLASDNTEALELEDLDLDGDLDLLAGNDGQDRLYWNDGTGAFTNATPDRVPWKFTFSSTLAVADVDLDGDQDLLSGEGEHQGYPSSGGDLFLNDGTGSFSRGPGFGPHANTLAIAAGDVDGDADPDVVFGNTTICFLGYGCYHDTNRLFFNDGQGGFSEIPGRLPEDSDDTFAVALGDLDADSDLDIVFGNWQQQSRVYRNFGIATGEFIDVTAGRFPARADRTRALALGDVDGDSDLDLVVGNESQQSRLFVNEGLGAFFDATATRMPTATRKTRALGIGDVDRDGDLDLVLGNDGQAGLYLNDGTGRFLDQSVQMPVQAEETWALQLGDVDEDGDLDVVLGNRDRFYSVALNRLYLNDGAGTFADETASRLPADLDQTAALALADIDRDRDLDLVVGNLAPSVFVPAVTNRLYLNLHRQLSARLLPLLSRTYEIELHSRPGYATAPRAAVVAFSFALLPSPVMSPPLIGELFLQPPLFFLPATSIPSPEGSTVIRLAVPSDPTLVGTTFYGQAAILGGGPQLTSYIQDTFGF